jgi:fido (protein-threonine AMPylation protein)
VPTPWDSDPPGYERQLLLNAAAALRSVLVSSTQRALPTIAVAQGWHRRCYRGIPLPVPYYAGEIRDSDARFPELVGYEVAVGTVPGAPSASVPAELATFERQARIGVSRIDAAIPVGAKPSTNGELAGVITLCALMHGEWVRIHPFANGNGRTARLWANWAAVRYGLPPAVNIKPRPRLAGYNLAAAASMSGHHAVAVAVFGELFRDALATGRV